MTQPDPDRLRPIAANLVGALIALDFDGTLAPIVPDPTTSRPVPGVVATLHELAEAGARIAIVTGRNAETVLALSAELAGIEGLLISGLHGAETWQHGRLVTQPEPAGIAELRAALPALLPHDVWLEDKRLSLVVHTRQAADPEQAFATLCEPVSRLAAQHGLETHPGKQVLELRMPGPSKATALDSLLTDRTPAALFAGDDLGDLPAVTALRAWSERTGRPGYAIAVGEVAELAEVADGRLDTPAELAIVLAGLLPAHR
ncbi:MAG TPA: trehalose-phosphatase [Jatrophihabitans sp.]|nr:trehalose-phosphatase [Jatrophihabitans sp.]